MQQHFGVHRLAIISQAPVCCSPKKGSAAPQAQWNTQCTWQWGCWATTPHKFSCAGERHHHLQLPFFFFFATLLPSEVAAPTAQARGREHAALLAHTAQGAKAGAAASSHSPASQTPKSALQQERGRSRSPKRLGAAELSLSASLVWLSLPHGSAACWQLARARETSFSTSSTRRPSSRNTHQELSVSVNILQLNTPFCSWWCRQKDKIEEF